MVVASLNQSPSEYRNLYSLSVLLPEKKAEVEAAVKTIKKYQAVYEAAVTDTKCPWFAVGIMDYMECNCSQSMHIHNGDSLKARTVQVPAGRPMKGTPPFTKATSITDWMQLKKWHTAQDWDIANLLYRFEANNGFGYRRYKINSPYLWSYSNLYTKGKFVADGKYSAEAVSKQPGAAILLKYFL